ncbi:MAG: DNA-binding response regulator [Chloroflexi bacterium HGW-Chloroflexi-10]|nr:MAG: DNA-binding response regulator [Chloroflexi bacterium HGW-Chloroflexi-10]
MSTDLIKVIIVDDQALVREGIASLLAIQPGLQVIGTAENGEQAIRVYQDLRPDVTLMDIRMPVLDGISASQAILKEAPNAIILMLTTLEDEEYIVKSLKCGARGYLLKDILAADLAQAVRLAYHGIFQLAPSVAGQLINISSEKEKTIPKNDYTERITDLTPRELDVLKLIATGATNKEIAQKLYLSEGTVKNIVSNIFTCLGANDRVQAAIIAIHGGLG